MPLFQETRGRNAKEQTGDTLYEGGNLNLGKRSHNLEKWCERAEISNFKDPLQKMILHSLTEIIIHHGRYPVSTRWDKSQPTFWNGEEYDHVLLNMINYLQKGLKEYSL